MKTIGYTHSPNNGIVITETTDIFKVKMSCGGGMGGSCWNEYGVFLKDLQSNRLLPFSNINNEQIVINTSFVVKAETKKLIKVEEDITPWMEKCWNSEIGKGYKSRGVKKLVSVRYYAVNPNEEIVIDNDKYQVGSLSDDADFVKVVYNETC